MTGHQRSIIGWTLSTLLLIGAVVLCVVRWNAWFGMPQEPEWEDDAISYRFACFGDDSVPGFTHTALGWQDTIEPQHLRLVVLGDVHNSLTRADWDSMAARHDYIDAYAQLGDFVERCYYYYFQSLYRELDSSAFATKPIMATPGNHEYNKGIVKTLDPVWTDIFRNPQNGPRDFPGTSYYVDFPRLRFIAIDTDGLHSLRNLLRTQTWAKRCIKTASGRFVVVMMHHPVYSTGAGRQNIFIRWVFRSVLSHADLVFAGHDHNYARRLPFVDTNSAKKYYLSTLNKKDTRVASGYRMYELLTLTEDTLLMQTYLTDTGQLYDEVRIIRHKDGSRATEDHASQWRELIELPAKYADRQEEMRVRRFLNKRKHRLSVHDEPFVKTDITGVAAVDSIK